MSGQAQAMDADTTMDVPSGPQGSEEIEYRLMVLRRASAGQVGSWGGTASLAPTVEQVVLPGWTFTVTEAGAGRVVFWALEKDGQTKDYRLWVWNTDGAAAWVIPENWSGALPQNGGLGWLRAKRHQMPEETG